MATKDFSSKQENMIADYLGWSVVAGSGAAACFPGDVIGDNWLGECKTHVERGHKIFFDRKVWSKIKDEASVKFRFPVLFTDDGSQKESKTWCLFKQEQLDMSEVVTYSADCYCNKNITFDHTEAKELYDEYSRSCVGDKHVVFLITWEFDIVALAPLSTFKELFRE